MDPLLEDTEQHGLRARRRKAARVRGDRRRSWLERWLFSEIPAYRLSLLVGYAFAMYYGISALIAGIPAFDLTAPDGWTPIWAWVIVVAGPIGLAGAVHDSPGFQRVELLGVTVLTGGLTVYALSVLFLAYGEHDEQRVTAGATLAALAAIHLVRMLWLIVQVVRAAKTTPAAETGD